MLSGEPVWAIHSFIAYPVSVPSEPCNAGGSDCVTLTLVFVPLKLFPADLTALVVPACICGKTSC